MPELEGLLAGEAARYDIVQPPVAEIRRRRQRRLQARGAAVFVVSAALAGAILLGPGTGLTRDMIVADGKATPAGQSSPSVSASEPSDPALLVGQWLLEADGEEQGSAISLGEQLTVFRSCGVIDGQWKADGQQNLFVASFASGDNSCLKGKGPPLIPWLETAVAFAIDGDERRLLDKNGNTVAALRRGAKPTVGPNRSKEVFEEPPTVTPALRAEAQEPSALPAGVRPAGTEDLTRRWRPVTVDATSKAHLAFQADGHWRGSDGCNGQGGRYVLGRDGRLLGTANGSTLIGCNGAPVGGWMYQAARAGVMDEDLVLYDQSGQLLGKLTATKD